MEQIPYPLPTNEDQRLSSLAEYEVMDTPPEEEFERLAQLASRLFRVPIVLISMIGAERQFFKSHLGLDLCETSREVSFCAHAIMQDDILVIPDAMLDQRFATNALVLGAPYIRFYAGKPLATPTGEKIGTLCLIDTQPRFDFSDEDRKNLTDLAALVMEQMELRRLALSRDAQNVRFENITMTSPDAIVCASSDEKITFWNSSAERLFGYSAAEITQHSVGVIIPDSWRPIYEAELAHLRRGEQMKLAQRTIELSGRRKDGSEFPAEYSLSTWMEGGSPVVGAIIRDITERKDSEERLFRLASIDALTDLPNRSAWQASLAQTLADGLPGTVLLIDIDRFREINDSFGHSSGDAVLREVAHRVASACSDAIAVARLAGDEFVVLLPGDDLDMATARARDLIAAVSQPFEFVGQIIDITVSIGIAAAPVHSSKPDELLGSANLALERAKAGGKRRIEMFVPAFREVAVARRAFEKELRRAFQNGEFELYYQPQVSTETGEIKGAEALMRWNHPERGLLTPASFIEVLSRKPSAPQIGEWILRTACRQAAEWRKIAPDFRIGVNLFEAQFSAGTLLPVVKDVLSDTGLAPEGLELEIVENILLRNDSGTLRLLQNLRNLGVQLAFDDYGTGFASLSLLKRYPVTRLKIDRSFIRNVNTDAENAAVVRAVTYLGKSFNLEVIAEGVETEAQRNFLRDNDCPESQGYFFGRPQTATDFASKFLGGSKTRRRAAAAGTMVRLQRSA